MLASTVGNPAGMHPTSTARPSAFALPKTSEMLTLSPRSVRSCVLPRDDRLDLVENAEIGARGVHVLVTAAGQVDHDGRGPAEFLGQPRRDLGGPGQRVRALDRR